MRSITSTFTWSAVLIFGSLFAVSCDSDVGERVDERVSQAAETVADTAETATAEVEEFAEGVTETVEDVAEGPLAGKRVAILVGEGFHDGETFFPLGYLTSRGAHVTVIGASTGEHGAYNSDATIHVARSVSDVSAENFDALVIPGGQGPANLREHEPVVDFARSFFETEKPVAAICHGPQVLITAGVLDGRHATAIEDIRGEMEEAGVHFHDEEVREDGSLITSRLPEDLPAFSAAIERQLLAAAD